MNTTSISLLERLRHPGHAQAWPRLVELYTPLLYYWARRTGLDENDAADLVQEVFAVLVQKLPTFVYDERKSFRGWLRTILLNKYRDGRRRASAVPIRSSDQALANVAGDNPEALWEVDTGHIWWGGRWNSCKRSFKRRRGRLVGKRSSTTGPRRPSPRSWGSASMRSTPPNRACYGAYGKNSPGCLIDEFMASPNPQVRRTYRVRKLKPMRNH